VSLPRDRVEGWKEDAGEEEEEEKEEEVEEGTLVARSWLVVLVPMR